jgi:DNA-binding transcriptional ArsR family regulator
MARATTTSDAFNAVAEPRRREILEFLAAAELPVGDLVVRMGLEQPSVSKHLKVLRDVGLVRVRRNGRHMMYRTNAEAIRPLHEWTKMFERLWAHQLLRIKERAEEKEAEEKDKDKEKEKEKEKEWKRDSAGAKAPSSPQRSDPALKRGSSPVESEAGYTQSGGSR